MTEIPIVPDDNLPSSTRAANHEPVERAFREAWRQAELLAERVASVHERVACPKCGAAVGERCVRVSSIARAEPRHQPAALALKHPHRERLRADGIQAR